MATCNWLWPLKLNWCSGDSSSNSQANENNSNKVGTRKSQLSPTSRMLDMLSKEKSTETSLKHFNGNEEASVFHDKTESDVDQILCTNNPTDYNSSNPRSVKNMSYLKTPGHEEINNSSFLASGINIECNARKRKVERRPIF